MGLKGFEKIAGHPLPLVALECMAPRILLVDDFQVVRRTIRNLLDSHSLDVCGEAEDGKEAIEKVRQLRPNLVLLDINMPGMNGIQAAFEIRQLSPATKILFLSVQECSAEAFLSRDPSPRGRWFCGQIRSQNGTDTSLEAPIP